MHKIESEEYVMRTSDSDENWSFQGSFSLVNELFYLISSARLFIEKYQSHFILLFIYQNIDHLRLCFIESISLLWSC